jgi:hypothetical protein
MLLRVCITPNRLNMIEPACCWCAMFWKRSFYYCHSASSAKSRRSSSPTVATTEYEVASRLPLADGSAFHFLPHTVGLLIRQLEEGLDDMLLEPTRIAIPTSGTEYLLGPLR